MGCGPCIAPPRSSPWTGLSEFDRSRSTPARCAISERRGSRNECRRGRPLMPAACIALVAGAAVVVLPTPTITLAGMHTVEKTRWEEDYQAYTGGVAQTGARLEAIGDGVRSAERSVREERGSTCRNGGTL